MRALFLGAEEENLARAREDQTGRVRDWEKEGVSASIGKREGTYCSEDGGHGGKKERKGWLVYGTGTHIGSEI